MYSNDYVESPGEDYLMCLGKIVLNKKYQIVYICDMCKLQLQTLRRFVRHLSAIHRNDILNNAQSNQDDEVVNENDDPKIAGITNNKDSIDDPSQDHFIGLVPELHGNQDAVSEYENCINPAATLNMQYSQSTKKPNKNSTTLKKFTRLKTENVYKVRNFFCNICNSAFANKYSCRAHMRRHTGKKPFACKICSKGFFTSTELNTHMCSHTGERPFVCETCGRNFVTSSHMRAHMLRHTNERPYKCEFCGKRFFGGGELKEHINIHSDKRNYVCEICNASFKKSGVLRSHKKIHENKREYICNICNAAFNQGPALYSHKKIHGENLHSMNLSNLNNNTDIPK